MRKALGLDIGYGGLKVVGGAATFELPAMNAGMYSRRATAALAATVGERVRGDDDSYEVVVDGEVWKTCFDPARVSTTSRNIDDNYIDSKEYKALFYTGLVLAGMKEIDMLVTGLPVVHAKDPAMKAKLVAMMKGIHEVQPGRFVSVKDVAVIPQPYGGYMLWESMMASDDGVDPDEATVVVVDPGTYSVDWALFEKRNVRPELNGSSTKASFVIMNEARGFIQEDCKPHQLPVSKLESAILADKKTILMGGENVEIAPYLARAAARVVPDVVQQIKPNLRITEGSADRVVLVGGGSHFFKDELLKEWGPKVVVVPDEPVTANAAGFFLFACEKLGSME